MACWRAKERNICAGREQGKQVGTDGTGGKRSKDKKEGGQREREREKHAAGEDQHPGGGVRGQERANVLRRKIGCTEKRRNRRELV